MINGQPSPEMILGHGTISSSRHSSVFICLLASKHCRPSYFTKFETYTESVDYPDVKMSNKGTKGPVRVGYFPAITKHAKAFIDACKSLGIPFSADFNTGESPTGVNRLSTCLCISISPRNAEYITAVTYVDDKLERVTSETAYLTPEVLARPNLKVAIHAQVTKILVRTTGEEKQAYAVEFTNDQNGPVYRARARKEVILSFVPGIFNA